jgi:hypothetical protein
LAEAVADFAGITRRTAEAGIAAVAVIGLKVHAFVVARGQPNLARQITLSGAVADFALRAYFTSTIYRRTAVGHTRIEATVSSRIRAGATGAAKETIGERIDTAAVAVEQFFLTTERTLTGPVTGFTGQTRDTAHSSIATIPDIGE